MKKKIKKILLIIFAAYLLMSVYLSARVYFLVLHSLHTYGEENNYSDIISDKMYHRLCYRKKGSDNNVADICLQGFSTTFHCFTKSKTFYYYWYDYWEFNENADRSSGGGSSIVIVNQSLINGKWVVTNVIDSDTPIWMRIEQGFDW